MDFKFMKSVFKIVMYTLSLNINRYFNYTFHEFKVLKKVIITEAFNVDFHNKFIEFGLFRFFYFFHTIGFNFLIYFVIYIYIYVFGRR